MAATDKPIEEDLRADDEEYNPAVEPKKSKAWLNLLQESEDAYIRYNEHCDLIDRQYASLDRLGTNSRDKEFQMFWSNCEVLKPSIYSKPPVPAVTPKFMDTRPVSLAAAEFLERCVTVSFDLSWIDELMKLVRDDLALIDRGVVWVRYEGSSGKGAHDHEKVCLDFKNRRDFLHSISRNWREVTWVAAASYLTRGEARKRFAKYSGDAYQDAEYKVDRDQKEVGGVDNRERAKFWEIWSKNDRRVLWVSAGVEDILDEDDPHLDLRGFFPCPKPAYGTVQRGSLVPVPDVLQYKDQLEEINLLTGKIHALSDALEAKGFYPAGSSEIADAVQSALAMKTPGRMLVPISNWAAFGGSKEVIIWLPIDMIAQTITGLVALRKQIIDDIYQIMGLSDIMRGSTSPEETLGAQQLKSEYGSARIRDKQQELVRLARDLVEITSEIITDKFATTTMINMSQTQLPTKAELEKQIKAQIQQLEQGQMQMQQAQTNPQMQANPQALQQANQQAQAALTLGISQIQKLQAKPTLDQVLTLLKDTRSRGFILDIETDSTIQPNEDAEKKARTEVVATLAQLLPQLSAMITAEPKTASFCGEILKFAMAPFRAGRALEGAITEMVDLMKEKGDSPQGDDPTTAQNKTALQIEQMKVDAQKAIEQNKLALAQQELQMKDKQHAAALETQKNIKLAELQALGQDDAAKAQLQNQKAMHDREKHQLDIVKAQTELDVKRQQGEMAIQQAQQKANDQAQHHAQSQEIARMKAMQMQYSNGGAI